MKPRRHLADVLAEPQDDALLVGLNAKENHLPHDDRDGGNGDQKQQRARHAAAATHHLLNLVLPPLEHLFQVRRLPPSASRSSLAPWPTAIAAAFPTAAATLIIPRHV